MGRQAREVGLFSLEKRVFGGAFSSFWPSTMIKWLIERKKIILLLNLQSQSPAWGMVIDTSLHLPFHKQSWDSSCQYISHCLCWHCLSLTLCFVAHSIDSVRCFYHSSCGPCNYRFLKFIQQAYTYFQVILLTYFMLLAFSHEFTIVLYNFSLKARSCEKQHFVIHPYSFALLNTENTQLNGFINLEKDTVHEI